MTNQRAVGGVRRQVEAEVGADVPTRRTAIEDRILLVGDSNTARESRSRSNDDAAHGDRNTWAVEDRRRNVAALNHKDLREMGGRERIERRRRGGRDRLSGIV